jgi:subtilisin family serine protease
MKKTVLTMLMAAALFTAPLSASAAQRSFYDYASGLTDQNSQTNFVNRMIRSYTDSNKRYKSFLDKYKRFAAYSFYQRLKDRYDFQVAEIEKYQELISHTPVVTVVDVQTTTEPYTISRDNPTTVSSETSTVVEERTETEVTEWAVKTIVYETVTRTWHYNRHTTVTKYSDGAVTTSQKSDYLRVENASAFETVVEREKIRSYAIVIEQEEQTDEVSQETTTVLTEEEYLARSDVKLQGTDVYREAVHKLNSRINVDYITRDSGLGLYGNMLEQIGAPTAWSRGYTGKGSTIAILDTGIDLDHSEFDGRIAGTGCFTSECLDGYATVDDENRKSHGTHVAGIAAAALDGSGTTGVAPDAELLIAKTAYNSGYFEFSKVDEAIAWAVDNGADVINMSANMNVDRTYKSSLEQIDNGFYYSTDTRGTYQSTGYNELYVSDSHYKNIVEAMKDHEAVLVMAAGNQGLDVAGLPSNLAIDPDVGNRVLVVGNWDVRKNDLHRSSNRAGTLCLEKASDGTCANKAKVSDRYIMAPGMYVASTDKDGEYVVSSGTSMAAPVVSGAVAVVHQMWPHMTGENVSQLLLNTASKDITNYNVDVHGQGLLDLAEATSPQGAVGLPTTGRVEGGIAQVSNGTMALSGGSISALEEVMLIDDYDRDFYFDANQVVQVMDTRTASATQAAQHGVVPDYYFGYASGTVLPINNGAVSINDDTHEVAIAYQADGISFGLTNESKSFLGNIADSDMMRVTGATTAYAGYSFDDGNLFGGAQFGATSVDVDSSSYLKNVDTILSYSATLGVKQTIGSETFGFVTSLPVSIAEGNAQFSMPGSVSSNGDIVNTNVNSSFTTDRQEVDFGLFYNNQITDAVSVDSFAEVRTNYAGTSDNTYEVGLNLKVTF